ncbi:glutamate racemase [Flavilitoribacter nigricans]|uniref:Glutamate racemase n=1 Tax=Flavilitoribacter nigricans (strain ATCC 23147 / DSM 23189 / NBRC 102662 / NCIMB 1420 / SS-2) TaxID=1122177 RepID=A0A2D0N6X6_FLAN2|nr:glutamate racemase [Flavilitoribacter nigricans]PHN04245.1 glutamate racemase [Flavilitoribacter nigricans DSM 23189 = NBRC 102662]
MDQAIGVFDSGIGGLTVANAILERLPQESILYFADTAHIPYGQKSLSSIRQYSLDITEQLLQLQCKAIVVACNTASGAALSYLRDCFPDVIIVGMEPAVKPAAEATHSGVVGILATAGTFKSERYAQLMERYTAGIRVLQNPCVGLVELIEAGETESPATEALLRSILDPMLESGADTFVLGCTHYPFVRPLISRLLPETAVIIDPAPAVARQLDRRLSDAGLKNQSLDPPEYRFHASGPQLSLERALARYWPADFSIF